MHLLAVPVLENKAFQVGMDLQTPILFVACFSQFDNPKCWETMRQTIIDIGLVGFASTSVAHCLMTDR